MRSTFLRSSLTFLSITIAALLVWLISIVTANSPAIVSAAPDGGVVGSGTPASCTEAAFVAKLNGGGTITFACGASPYTITLTSGKSITTNTTIDGGGKITLSGGNAVRQFVVNSGQSLTVKNITLADGKSTFGGCVASLGAFSAIQSTLRNCHSAYTPASFFPPDGGAIAVLGGNLYLSNTHVLNNSADLNGGGIYLGSSIGQLEGVDVLNNTAWFTYTGSGGGIYVDANSLLNIYNSHIDNNKYGYLGQGGGIAAYSNTLQLFNVTLRNSLSTGAGSGGGLYVQGATAILDHVTASGNSGGYDGGGITSWISAITLTNSSLSNNIASSNGGGINTYQGSLSLNNVMVNNNVVESDGGGIDLYSTSTSLISVTVNNNTGGRDGAGINSYRSTLTLDRVTVSGNQNTGEAIVPSQGYGGGIYNDSGALIATNSTIDHNTSTGTAGGIYNTSDSIVNLTNVTLSSNLADTNGGGIYNEASFSTDVTAITLTNVTLKDNRAFNGGGVFNGNTANNFIYLKNTIIADNAASNCAGKAFTSAKYSLSSDNTCTLSGVDNHTNTPAQLFPLLNNGGTTLTHLPAPTSVAVNGVSGVDCPLTDQRGVSRPQGLGCDIGAVERQPSDPVIAPWIYLPLIQR